MNEYDKYRFRRDKEREFWNRLGGVALLAFLIWCAVTYGHIVF